jgi:hypothetical protein
MILVRTRLEIRNFYVVLFRFYEIITMWIWLKRTGFILLIPIVLVLSASVLLYVPPFQNAIVGKAAEYASKSMGMNVEVERVRLSFPLNLSLHNMSVVTSGNDTLLYLGKLTLHVRLRPLLKGNISVSGIRLEKLDFNTGHLIDGMAVKGCAGEVYLKADSINPAAEYALLNSVRLSDADIEMFMCDTTAADTSKSGMNWYVDLRNVELRNVALSCRLPCDSIYLGLQTDKAILSGGIADLKKGRFEASNLLLNVPEISYGTDLREAARGFDMSHIRLSDVHMFFDSLYYESGGKMQALLKECSAGEQSGITFRSVTGSIVSDDVRLHVPSFLVQTEYSTLRIKAVVPWSAIDSNNPRSDDISVVMSASVGKEDLMSIAGDMPENFLKNYPDTSFHMELSAGGNADNLNLHKLDACLPGAMHMHMTGAVKFVADERNRTGSIRCKAETQDMDFVTGMLPSSLKQHFRVPDSMSLAGDISVNKGLYNVSMIIRECEGSVKLSGKYDTFGNSYEARLNIDSLEPVHFMPGDSVMLLNASVRLKGQGTDFYHSSTWADMEGKINEICYAGTSISKISLTGNLRDNRLQAEVSSAYPLLGGRISIDGDMKKDHIKGMLIVDVDTLDFYGFGLTETPLTASFQIFSEIESDLKKGHSLDVTLGNCNLIMDEQTIQPKMLTLAFRSNEDTVRASLRAGDLSVMLTGNTDLMTLANKLVDISGELEGQLRRDSMLNFQELRSHFPDMSVRINAERDNPLHNFMQEHDVFFETLDLNLAVSPEKGFLVDGKISTLMKDTLKIDTIRLNVWQDTLGLQYVADISKKHFRNQEAFHADAHGYIRKDDADVFASYTDSGGEKGLLLGINIKKTPGGFDFNFYPEKPVIAFLPFTVNDNNYFRFKNLKEMEADLRFEGDSHTSVWIHSAKSDNSANEMMVELNGIDLEYISSKFARIPPLKGLLNVALRYEPMESAFMVVADAGVDNLYYENGYIGELLMNVTYMPIEKGTHQIDLHVFHDMSEISSLSVLYEEGRHENRIDGVISVDELPMKMFNALIPGRTVTVDGAMSANFAITGTDKDPLIDGALQIDKGSAYVIPSATALYFDDKRINVSKNKIYLDKYKIYPERDNPLVIDGIIDATNTSRPNVDIKMSATNMQLVNSKKTPENPVYGRMFLNINTTLTGTLQSLRMRGDMHVLGNTNLTCVMPESPLEVRDRFNNLITFTRFDDTLLRRTRRPFNFVRRARNLAAISGTDVLLNIRIDPVVKIRINDEEQSNFVELRGGGDLSLQYSAQGDMRLNGRYTLSDGTIRYSIPLIPLTNFSVKKGSYVDWSGDPENPYLNITAYSHARSTVDVDGQKKAVDFNAGIQLRNNLGNVSVQFILEAPTEAVVQNQLTSMGAEERSKQAVSLLVTGVYLANGSDGNSNLDVGQALNSLLQRKIKNVLGNLLGDVPFSFDVETYDGTQQGMGRRIDYIGRFYKNFFNERFNTTLGLRYSTKDPVFGNKFFLDDISLEYLLDADGARSVKTFRSKEYENLFEGEIDKTGIGFSLSRKVKYFRDLFISGKQDAIITEEKEEEEEEEFPDETELPENETPLLLDDDIVDSGFPGGNDDP